MIPEIAIIGHPNEGKSSVLSTLAEDDSVRVSPIPGETTVCRSFPVIIDHTEVLRFTDTPGFQNPQRILAELKKYSGSSGEKLKKLRQFTAKSPDFHDDHELMTPIDRGAAIIYVVDGSRPVRNVDRSEMEILRLIGKPRMAILNCKNDTSDYVEEWQDIFRTHFNSSRIFNAHRATYAERIELLETLKAIDQEWHSLLSEIIEAFKKDWESRTRTSAAIICTLLEKSLSFNISRIIDEKTDVKLQQEKLFKKYCQTIIIFEKEAQQQIKQLFKHNIFNYSLPPYSILKEDLFNKKTWQMLGLTTKQMAIAGGISGAAVGAGIDITALGHGLGAFTAIGGIIGAVGALTGSGRFTTRASIMGVDIAGTRIEIGPAQNIELLFILINRSLLFYRHTINWSHGKRQHQGNGTGEQPSIIYNYSENWTTTQIKLCHTYFKAVQKTNTNIPVKTETKLFELIFSTLMQISRENTSKSTDSDAIAKDVNTG